MMTRTLVGLVTRVSRHTARPSYSHGHLPEVLHAA